MRFFFFICLFLFGYSAFSQNLTGSWKVTSGPSLYYTPPTKVIVELQQYQGNLISGVSHYYYAGNYYEHYRLSGRIDKATGNITINEDSLINYHIEPGTQLFSGKFQLVLDSSQNILSGRWIPYSTFQPSINYTLERPNRIIVKEKARLDTSKVIQKVEKSITIDRADRVVKVLEIDASEADSLKIEVYDNGEIDGDTITVFVNNRVVINKKMISEKPLTFITSLTTSEPITHIKMIAENLGSIPPNSALMIITTKKHRYTVSLSSDLKSNGVLELFLKQ